MNTQNRGRRKGGPKKQQNQPPKPQDHPGTKQREDLKIIAYGDPDDLVLTPSGQILIERCVQEYFHKGEWRVWSDPRTLKTAGICISPLKLNHRRRRFLYEYQEITLRQSLKWFIDLYASDFFLPVLTESLKYCLDGRNPPAEEILVYDRRTKSWTMRLTPKTVKGGGK